MKIALVHDHLTQDGGAEKVLKIFQEIFPTAPTYTLIYDQAKAGQNFQNRDIRTSFIQKLPWGVKKYQWYLPLMPSATESYDLMDYDVVLSSSSGLAKGVITGPQTLHICYCHTPTRYLWTDTHSYVKELSYNRFIKKIIPLILVKVRMWDKVAAARPDRFIANSKTVKKRIAKYYRRSSVIINPPVETSEFRISKNIDNYYLIGGRLVAYKRYDLAVEAFNKMGLRLKVFGLGPEEENLHKKAKSNIEFLGRVSQAELVDLYSHALAFIHPQIEDFGITSIEAMASGRPVIAYARGGALESVVDGLTGKFFYFQDWEALADTVIRFKPEDFNPVTIRAHALKFDVDQFKYKIKEYIEKSWQEFSRS